MRFTDTAIENIDKAMGDWQRSKGIRYANGINIRNDAFREAYVYINDHQLFKVSEMWSIIKELNAMVEIVKDTVGIYEEV